MSHKIILVTGGTRSGKSVFAEKYVQKIGSQIAYIATAQIYDAEMQNRVDVHRDRRPANWKTFEAPYEAERAICEAAASCDTILFDCLTLYTSNLLLSPAAPANKKDRFNYVIQAVHTLLNSIQETHCTIVFVTNEVGMGIVPENALAREFRDVAGSVNQLLASYADEVYLVVSVIAVNIKRLAVKLAEEEQDG